MHHNKEGEEEVTVCGGKRKTGEKTKQRNKSTHDKGRKRENEGERMMGNG